MGKASKKYSEARSHVEAREYPLEDAVALIQEMAFAKFDESVDIAVLLGVDPKHADQMVRGTVILPHGTGKTKRVLVVASGEKIKEAEDAGADEVGGADAVKKIQDGWMEFDAVVATPDMMKDVGRLGKILGPRGMMPNPKTGILHNSLGKVSFDPAKLVENVQSFMAAVVKSRPPVAKGKYLKSIHLSSTMGPSVKVDPGAIEVQAAA